MKKYFILLFTWAIACAFTFATDLQNATDLQKGEDIIVKFQKGDIEKTVVIRLANLEKLTTEVGILSTEGAFWYSEFIRKEHGYATKFNLKDMPDGEYVLFATNASGIWAQAFNMDNYDIVFFEKPASRAANQAVASLVGLNAKRNGSLITKFYENGEQELKIKMQLANLQNEPTIVDIISLDNGLVFSKTVKGEISLSETLNLKGANNGCYILYVHGVDASVVQFFSIKNGTELKLGELQRLDRPALVPDEGFSSVSTN
jgi:hypothetical protein